MSDFNEETFDLGKFIDELTVFEEAQDMHNSVYFDPESKYDDAFKL